MKTCTKCGISKPILDFYKIKKTDGLNRKTECKQCTIARVNLRNSNNPDFHKQNREQVARYKDNHGHPGVYILEIGEKYYIGSSNYLEGRCITHASNLKVGKNSPLVQAAYNAHGSYKFKVILVTNEYRYYERLLLEEHKLDPNCLNTYNSRFPKK